MTFIYPHVPYFFGRTKSKNNEIYRKWGLKERTNQEIREDYIKRAAGVVSKLGLTLPEINLKDYD